MILCIADVLSQSEVKDIRKDLARSEFAPGARTAGWAARPLKENLQLSKDAEAATDIQQKIRRALYRNELLTLIACPKQTSEIVISKYTMGMRYGNHVDNALMGGNERMRSDLSFTLFLSDTKEYEGGELVIEMLGGSEECKLEAGSMVLYASTSLHRVEPVTSGCRLVAVGWIQSSVRDPRHREILFELETLKRRLYDKEGATQEFDSLNKSVSNLWRLWIE